MPVLSISTTYADGDVLTESQLNEIKTGIETFLNTTKIDGDNIQTGGIPTAALANTSVTAAKIGTGAVETAKLADDAVTRDKIASNVAGSGLAQNADGSLEVTVDGSTLEINSDTVRVKDSGITTAKLNDGAVTQAKRAALGEQSSSNSGAAVPGSTSLADVSGVSISLTTTGRPVFVGLQPAATLSSSGFSDSYGLSVGQSAGDRFLVNFVRVTGGTPTTIASYVLRMQTASTVGLTIPASLFYVDAPSSGTHTYKVQIAGTSGSSLSNVKLIAFEL